MTSISAHVFAGESPSPARTGPRRRRQPAGALLAFLRAPLVLKLIGANVVITLATVALVILTQGTALSDRGVLAVLLGAIVLAQVVNSALVIIALRPIRALEEAAARVVSGEPAARVPYSPLADRNIARTGRALNGLLDTLMQERDRIRRLAKRLITVQDEERARIARELNDATAQTMAAVVLQLSVAKRSCTDVELAKTLHDIHQTAAQALEGIRTLSHTVYPRVLQDLGLGAALEWLARRTGETTLFDVGVTVRGSRCVPATVASALYRVAEESLLNAVRHSSATTVELRLDTDQWFATLEVEDDGIGFDVVEAEARRPEMGIFSMKEGIALANGVLDIESGLGRGCCVRASVPLTGRGCDDE